MVILLFGAKGQVGFELQRSLAGLGQVVAYDRNQVDLENFSQLETIIYNNKPDVIVNAAAYTQVDKAQTEQARAQKINAKAPGVMANIASDLNAFLIHYSTDYVFDGKKSTPYEENDKINPLSVYGETKAAGEEAIRISKCKHLILRTSWVYAARGRNFARTILRLAQERDSLTIVGDQIGAPTSAELIADITTLLLYRIQFDTHFDNFIGDTFHLTAQGAISWHDFANYLITNAAQMGITFKATPENISAINTNQYPTAAARPANSVLSTQKINDKFDIQLPSWQIHANRVLAQIYGEL